MHQMQSPPIETTHQKWLGLRIRRYILRHPNSAATDHRPEIVQPVVDEGYNPQRTLSRAGRALVGALQLEPED